MFSIEFESKTLMGTLERVARSMHDATPLMASIATELHTQTDENFAAEGRPKWLGLRPATIAMRRKRGTWPGRMLQIGAGGLASSISTSSDANSTIIGSNKVYAAMQQLGGTTSPRSMIPNKVIPARQYLPIDAQGNPQPEAEESILGIANSYLANIIAR